MTIHADKVKYSSFPYISHEHMQTMLKCYSVCSSCSKFCIEENHPETAILCADCADICALAIKLHSSDSEFTDQVMTLCSDACARCAQACGEVDEEHCRQCSQICQECFVACKH